MTRGVPRRVTQSFKRASQPVRVVVTLSQGELEELELLVHCRSPKATRSEVVREAIGWMLAREATRLVRYRTIEAKRAEQERMAAEALAFKRQQRDVWDAEHERTLALALARGETTTISKRAPVTVNQIIDEVRGDA